MFAMLWGFRVIKVSGEKMGLPRHGAAIRPFLTVSPCPELVRRSRVAGTENGWQLPRCLQQAHGMLWAVLPPRCLCPRPPPLRLPSAPLPLHLCPRKAILAPKRLIEAPEPQILTLNPKSNHTLNPAKASERHKNHPSTLPTNS